MSIAYPRLVRGRAPRHALWCRQSARSLLADGTASLVVVVGEAPVRADRHAVVRGRLAVRVADGWCWPNDEPDQVGEFTLSTPERGLSAIGWWSPTGRTDGATSLVLEIAGLTLWTRDQQVTTEEPARIRAVLGG